MRALTYRFVVATGLSGLLACGGSSPGPQAPPGASSSAPPSAGVVVPVGDAGPTTTTTDTLAADPAAGGTRLTPIAASDAGDGAPHPKHQGEIGRGVADIQAIVASHRDEARACYDGALAAHPGIEGTIDIRWTIDPAGLVSAADVDSSHTEILEPSVGVCLVGIIKKIHFNASPKGFETKAHYPFNFHPRAHHAVQGDATH